MNDLIVRAFVALKTREEGAASVEYGLLVALIAVAIIAAVAALGGGIRDTFNTVTDAITGGTN